MTATATVTGVLRPTDKSRFGSPVGRATVEFDGGKIVLLTREREMIERISQIGAGSRVEVRGELKEQRWPIGGGGWRSELRLEPTELRLLHDARKERMLGV